MKSDKEILQALVSVGLLSRDQALEVLKNKATAVKQLEKTRKHSPSPYSIRHPVTLIDVIAAMGLKRADAPEVQVDEDSIYQLLAEHWSIPYVKVDPLKLDLNLVTSTIPRKFALNHLVLPIHIEKGELTVATPNPFNNEVFDDIRRVTHLKIVPVISSASDIKRMIQEFFGFRQSIAAAEDQFDRPAIDLGNLEQYVRLHSADEFPSNDQHIVNAVNHLFSYGFEQRASDIHIEPKREFTLVRMRIDGVLHTVYSIPKKVHNAIVSRIKTLSRLDMAEKRRPQDGRIKTDKDGVEVEIRVSTVPVAFGEKVVMRIMDPDILFQDIDQLGFTPEDLERYRNCIHHPFGIVLVCGPTGSGKSTTLYSSLRRLSTPEINITTVEDPIEMVHEDFNQIAVQPAVGITFSTILRNILRQDPDIIMLGEMRDIETAENAIQAALTGHLVLSTLHTNDAPSAITRLLDMGVPAFLIQATLVGVMGQRLVRKICKSCKESFTMPVEDLEGMGLQIPTTSGELTLYRGKGCSRCRGTGYRGRSAVVEVLPYTNGIRRMTTEMVDLTELKRLARQEGMVTLRENGIRKMLAGITTYQEVLKATVEDLQPGIQISSS